MISKATIDSIFEAIRVEEVIGDFVQLKKSGSNYKGLSPFVNEKTPSFMVSPSKQIWKDFSSGKGGNAVSFMMEHEHFTYPEALRYLAKKYNIEIEETEQTDEEKLQTNEKESMFLVSEFANKYFQNYMNHTEIGKSVGLSYFKERGFTFATIEKFQLGYAPDEWEVFSKDALGKGYQLEYLEKTGLTIVKGDRYFDRFKGRVMFPIQSMSGRVLGFGGRILSNDKKAAKYLNSPESEIYHKSKVLYGIFQAKQAIAKEDSCFIVEGYTDVIQMHQAGIENIVSSSGTALTTDQIRIIKRLTPNVTVLFDGDAAGLRASIRGIDLLLEAGMNVRICTFPDGEDPDSFARKTPVDELKRYLTEQATDFIRFKTSLLIEEAQNDPIKKAELIRDIVSSISKISDAIQREVYVQDCARLLDISEDVLFNTLAQIGKKEQQEAGKLRQQQKALEVVKSDDEIQKQEKVDIIYLLERKIIEIILLYGHMEQEFQHVFFEENSENEIVQVNRSIQRTVIEEVFTGLHHDEMEFANPLFRNIYADIISFYQRNSSWNLNEYLLQIPPEFSNEITSIIMENERFNLHNWEVQNIFVKSKEQGLEQYVSETLLTLRWYLLNEIISDLKNKIPTTTEEERIEFIKSVMEYLQLSNMFSKKLGRVISRF